MTTRGKPTASPAGVAQVLVLGDGARISLRQVDAEDRDRLAALFARLSPQSRYRRFLSPKRELTRTELTFFTDVDHLSHEAVVAVDPRDDSVVGIARYVRVGDRVGVAEVAIEVADAFQRMGIGTALADLTIQHAQHNGLRFLTATTLWENHAARGLLRHHGFRVRQSHGGAIEHELNLEASGGDSRGRPAASRRPGPSARHPDPCCSVSDWGGVSAMSAAWRQPLPTSDAETLEAWDGPLFERFVKYRHIVVARLRCHGDETMRLHPPETGDRTLAIGCGLGETTRRLAALAGPEGLARYREQHLTRGSQRFSPA
jgi:RimJ/RimL family protein N-acetyltransferase